MNWQLRIFFIFPEEFVDQKRDLFMGMGSLGVDSLFTNTPLGKTIEGCTNKLFKESETVEGLSKTEFKQLLSPATKDSHFIFDGTLYKRIDGVAMRSLLDPTLANAFLAFWSTTRKIGLNIVHWNIDHYTVEGT